MTTSAEGKSRVGYIAFAASLGGLLFGFDTAVISGAIELVRSQFNLTVGAEGWFVSSGLLGAMIGVVMAGILSDRIGRKPVLLLSGLFFLLSGFGCSLTLSMDFLIVYRLIGGLGVGIASVISPLYITELVPAHIRGRMVAFYQLSITLGILSAYFSNAFLLHVSTQSYFSNRVFIWLFQVEVWRSMFLVMCIPSLFFIGMMLFVPESPRWLMAKKKFTAAKKALGKIYAKNSINQAYETLKDGLVKHSIQKRPLFVKALRLPLFIGIMLCILQQFSGINAIIYYGPKIFTAAGLDGDNALQAQVIIGVINMVFTTVAIYWSDRFGRKPLLFIGLSGMIISLVIVGACFYTGSANGVLLLGMLTVFIACFALSVGPVTWILVNEIFPTDVRVKAVSLCTFCLWIAVWLVGQFFPWLLEHAGAATVFWLFAGCCVINLIFCSKSLIETKGKSLEEIEDIYVPAH